MVVWPRSSRTEVMAGVGELVEAVGAAAGAVMGAAVEIKEAMV